MVEVESNLGEIYKYINAKEILVIGHPYKTNIFLPITEYFSEILFFEEKSRILVIVNNVQQKDYFLHLMKSILYDKYQFDNFIVEPNRIRISDENYLYITDKDHWFKESDISDKIDVLYIHENVRHFKFTDLHNLLQYGQKIIVSTYDYQDCVYYFTPPQNRIKITDDVDSHLSNVQNNNPMHIRRVRGEFDEYGNTYD